MQKIKIEIATNPLCEKIYVDHDIANLIIKKIEEANYDKILFLWIGICLANKRII